MPKKDNLVIKGAQTHNLKNISVAIPKNKLVVFCGVSGSGKSSLAFDTIYSEGQRRYVESLSSYARQFLGVMDKPDVESMSGISPAIAIDQKTVSKNPRSTVGTITEVYDYLRLLFSHIGVPHCPNKHGVIKSQSASQIGDVIKLLQGEIVFLAPLVTARKGEHRAILEEISEGGFLRVRVDGHLMLVDEALSRDLDKQKKHTIEVVIDRMDIEDGLDAVRLIDSVETALKIGKGILIVLHSKNKKGEWKESIYSEHLACYKCGFSMRQIEPRSFSFNSPYGACEQCSGLGMQMEVDPELVIPDTYLSIEDGAIKPWVVSANSSYAGGYSLMIRRIAQKYDISLSVPFRDLSQQQQTALLHGDERIEGVVSWLERRYKETSSDWARADIEKYMDIKQCPECDGRRLKKEALSVKVGEKTIDQITSQSIAESGKFFTAFVKNVELSKSQKEIVKPILKEIVGRLGFLEKVGLSYLTLARATASLSGGEGQRIRLATQLGSQLSGVFYILDEPSVGLHPRDQQRLINTMGDLRNLGNSVLVVEHDELTIQQSDWVIDVGPGAGKYGGKIMFEGTPKKLLRSSSLTGQYLSGRKKVDGVVAKGVSVGMPLIKQPKTRAQKYITIKGASEHNLKNIDVSIPLNKFVVVSGVSGSGKSSLVNDILAKYLQRELNNAHTIPGEHKKIEGLRNINKAIVIDQSPIGRTPRSNPATYTGVFSLIREIFALTQEAKVRGYSAGRFSFNVKGGRCEECSGGGVKKIEMFFLPDVYVECDVCEGKRYNKEALEVLYKGKTIADILKMTVDESFAFFKDVPSISLRLGVLNQVGLGYVELGQPAPSLSGGEAQRIKLASELARRDTGSTLYILDEPTTGMHFDDVNNLLSILKGLVQKGNSLLVIEHNLDMIRNADWIIDLGPEGGEGGGTVVAQGTPKQIARVKKSHTGKFLR